MINLDKALPFIAIVFVALNFVWQHYGLSRKDRKILRVWKRVVPFRSVRPDDMDFQVAYKEKLYSSIYLHQIELVYLGKTLLSEDEVVIKFPRNGSAVPVDLRCTKAVGGKKYEVSTDANGSQFRIKKMGSGDKVRFDLIAQGRAAIMETDNTGVECKTIDVERQQKIVLCFSLLLFIPLFTRICVRVSQDLVWDLIYGLASLLLLVYACILHNKVK